MKPNEPVFFNEEAESKALNEIGEKTTFEPAPQKQNGYDKYMPSVNIYKKRINNYWHVKNLHYLHKWLNKPIEELVQAQKTAGMPVAEYVIVKFLLNTANTTHPSLIKMLMDMSCGGDGSTLRHLDDAGDSPAKIVRKILLELPENKRKKDKDV